MSNKSLGDGKPQQTRVQRDVFEIIDHRISTMNVTPVAADTMKAIAKAQYAVPARQESVRVGIVVGGVIALTFVGHLIGVPTGLLVVAIVAVAGIYGLPKLAEKIRGAVTKDLLPPSE